MGLSGSTAIQSFWILLAATSTTELTWWSVLNVFSGLNTNLLREIY
jgi:hypothetical protein